MFSFSAPLGNAYKVQFLFVIPACLPLLYWYLSLQQNKAKLSWPGTYQEQRLHITASYWISQSAMMVHLRFYVLFNSISIISGWWVDDNERLCAMEPHLWLRRFRLKRSSKSVSQRLTHSAIGAPPKVQFYYTFDIRIMLISCRNRQTYTSKGWLL